jgi:hypothetical protein
VRKNTLFTLCLRQTDGLQKPVKPPTNHKRNQAADRTRRRIAQRQEQQQDPGLEEANLPVLFECLSTLGQCKYGNGNSPKKRGVDDDKVFAQGVSE